MSNDYWRMRARQNEKVAQEIAKQGSAAMKKLHNDTYRKLLRDVNYLKMKYDYSGELTRTELWRSKEYIQLLNEIGKECDNLREAQIATLTDELGEVFDTVIGRSFKDVGAFPTGLIDETKKKLLESHWCGANYSERIWHNTDALSTKLKDSITNYLLIGKDPREALSLELGVSYRQADRIVRTETAYITTQASLEAYREADIQEVEYIHNDNDGCEECKQYDGKIFPINQAPLLPIHPNCVCCLAPVIKKKKS